jgi:DNA repair exonuclease SbcCD ATPase subunit
VFVPGDDDDSSDTTDIDDARSTSETLEEAVQSPPEKGENVDSQHRPPLAHRRSSLKKSTGSIRASMDATKNVAWAMDQDWQEQVKKYDAAVIDAETAGKFIGDIQFVRFTDSMRTDRDWEAARASHERELANMRALRQNISRTLVKLRAETEKLQREDEMTRNQELKLQESYNQLEQNQTHYRGKGMLLMAFVCS